MKVTYKIKISLLDFDPPIWRTIIVPSNITFFKLHKIIQAAFNWQDYHVFNFDFEDTVVCLPDSEYAPGEFYGEGVEELNAKKIKIDQLFTEGKRFIYEYDLGDSWRHEIVIEEILEADQDVKSSRCLDGERHRPPEDVGGTGGYENFLEIINNPNHPEYDDMLVWAEKDTGGRKFDPEYFYLNEINRALMKIK